MATVAAAAGVIAVLLFVPLVWVALDMRRRAATAWLAHTYVFAAEQIFGSGHGKEKFVYVTRALLAHGIRLNEHDENDFVRALIEAEVRGLKYLERE